MAETKGLLFRSVGDRTHDYDPNWDYVVDERLDPKTAQFVHDVAERIHQELVDIKAIGDWLFGFEVWAARLRGCVALYIDGTSAFPVILVDLKKHRGYEDQFGRSIWHELKHAEQDSCGKNYDENEAEHG